MRSVGKQKAYAKKTLEERWITVTSLVWCWEAVFVVPAVLATLEAQNLSGGPSPVYLAVVVACAGPATYLLRRYFFRLVNYTIVHSDNRIMRVISVYVRSLLGLLEAAVLVWVATWLVDKACYWVPIGLRYLGAELPQLQLNLHENFLTTSLWWPLLVVLGGVVPMLLEPMWSVLIDDPHMDLVGALKMSLGMMKDHWKEFFRVIGNFWLWYVVAIVMGWGLVRFAAAGIDFYFGMEVAEWMYMVGVAIAAAPVIAYVGVTLVCFDTDAAEEYQQSLHPIQKSAVSEWVDTAPARTREQIQADMVESMRRRQAGVQTQPEPKQSTLAVPTLQPRDARSTTRQAVQTQVQPLGQIRQQPAQMQQQMASPEPASTAKPAAKRLLGRDKKKDEKPAVSDYAAPVGEAMMGEMPFGGNF